MAFDAEEVDFGHSLAVWPAPPQNMQRLSSNWRWRSWSYQAYRRWRKRIRRFAGLVVVVESVFLVFGGVIVGVGVVAGVLVLVLIIRLLVFGFIGFGLAGTGFLPESFPVMGVDGVGKIPHSLEC